MLQFLKNPIVIMAIVFGIICAIPTFICKKTIKPQYSFNVSLDKIRDIRELHLLRSYFEEVIPIDKKDKLKAILIVQAVSDLYINMDEVDIKTDSTGSLLITLPDIKVSDVNFLIDSAKIYDFKHFGISFSDNAYSEAIVDIQSGIAKGRLDVMKKSSSDFIMNQARLEAMRWFEDWGKLSSQHVTFVNLKN